MKKLFLLAVAAVACLAANAAYTLNNPIGEDGRYIVKYDCEKGQFAAANDFEADEAVTIAVDVTGTWLADWLKDTPIAEGASRGVAINNWTSLGDTNGDFRRMKQINGNIWGLTMKLSDLLVNAELAPQATMTDSVVYVYAQFFGFEYTNDNPGANWWMWNENTIDESKAEGSDCLFATLPYTGTKTSESFYGDEGFEAEEFDEEGFDIMDKISGIRCPVFAFGVEDDTVLSCAGTRDIIEATGCKSHLFQGSGHAVYDEVPHFKDILFDFFES